MTLPIIIAGAGIGGLATALTLHQIGARCIVLDPITQVRPLGVGINLQPNAVRELFDLGLDAAALDAIGIPAREWALVGLNGRDIYAETRGTEAGYAWPQYAVHRGRLQELLYASVCERLGADAVRLGQRVTGYRQDDQGVTVTSERADGTTEELRGALLIGADGIHSAVRAQMHPDQPPIHWGGTIMWRGVTRAKPLRTGSSFIGLGMSDKRMVIYPISPPGPDGLAEINWIAEITEPDASRAERTSWFGQVPIDSFAHHFDGWSWDWLDVPTLIRGASAAFENPMIDRDPIDHWTEGRVTLLGDAAHPMYPTGSNGASQAIVDARVLGACFLDHGLTPQALSAYDARLSGPIGQVVLRNRGAGPFGLLSLVEERCGGTFDDIDAVIPRAERDAFVKGYQAAAGYARDALNAAPPTIAPGARL